MKSSIRLYVLIMSRTHFRMNPHFGYILVTLWSHFTRIHNLVKWLSVCLRTLWLWVRVPLESLNSIFKVSKKRKKVDYYLKNKENLDLQSYVFSNNQFMYFYKITKIR